MVPDIERNYFGKENREYMNYEELKERLELSVERIGSIREERRMPVLSS